MSLMVGSVSLSATLVITGEINEREFSAMSVMNMSDRVEHLLLERMAAALGIDDVAVRNVTLPNGEHVWCVRGSRSSTGEHWEVMGATLRDAVTDFAEEIGFVFDDDIDNGASPLDRDHG